MKRKNRSQWEEYCRQMILDAVIRILNREGNTSLTMDKVAEEAGISKGSLYLCFKNKGELLEWIKEASLSPLREELTKILKGDLPTIKKLKSLVARHLTYFDEKRGIFRVLLWERQIAVSHMKRHANKRYLKFIQDVSSILDEGIKQGIFRKIDPMKLAVILIESDIALISQRLWSESPVPVQEDADMLSDVFLYGISAPHSGQGALA